MEGPGIGDDQPRRRAGAGGVGAGIAHGGGEHRPGWGTGLGLLALAGLAVVLTSELWSTLALLRGGSENACERFATILALIGEAVLAQPSSASACVSTLKTVDASM